jgi:hypothetical protein
MCSRSVLLAVAYVTALCGTGITAATDFRAEFDRLDKKVKTEQNEPRGNIRDDVGPYVHWMEVKARDRDQAQALAVQAGERNPYYRDLFTELVGDAQISGNITVKYGAEALLQFDETYDQYWTICYRLERHGKPLWEATVANKFDREIIRDRVRRMMRFSINNLENRWLWCCEGGQSVAEKEGHYIQGDFDMVYLPRSAFVKGSKTALDICPYVDEWLAEVEKCVRKPCEFFGLIGIYDTEATPMMEEYLEDTLCLRKDLGHKHYLDLAKQYKLRNAQEYIEGFYAKLKGTVWLEEADGRKPAKGAKVTVTDPKDNTTWTAVADAEGKYEIKDGLLHNHKGKDEEDRCPQFKISAEHQGDRVDDTYQGPLREPNRSAEHVKDLVIPRDTWQLQLAYHEQVTHNKRDVQTTSDGTATVENHITGSLDYTITATLKPAPQQPADALRPYRDTEEGLKELLAQPRPTNVPGATEEQTKEIEREEARMKTRAAEVAGTKGIRYYVVRGVQALIKDDFIHTETKTFVSKNARIEDDRRWEWHADKRGPIPLNIRLKTYANENSYHLTLTDHDPMDTGNPQARHSFTIPWNYSARKTLNGQTQLACAGTADVESDDNFPHNVFVHVPDGLLAYDGSQRELRGEHTWNDSHSELDVYRTETPGCKERRALHGSGVLPKNSVQKTLTWTLRKLGK